MEYDIDHDQTDAEPKHCTAVLHQWKDELQGRISDLITEFEKRTDLKLIDISPVSAMDCYGQKKFVGIKIQFDL